MLTAEKLDQDINATKADVEKVRVWMRLCHCILGELKGTSVMEVMTDTLNQSSN